MRCDIDVLKFICCVIAFFTGSWRVNSMVADDAAAVPLPSIVMIIWIHPKPPRHFRIFSQLEKQKDSTDSDAAVST